VAAVECLQAEWRSSSYQQASSDFMTAVQRVVAFRGQQRGQMNTRRCLASLHRSTVWQQQQTSKNLRRTKLRDVDHRTRPNRYEIVPARLLTDWLMPQSENSAQNLHTRACQ
jgi:hypothetical protein